MILRVWTEEQAARAMDDAIADANRTLSKHNVGLGYARVVALVAEELFYDTDKDDLIATGKGLTRWANRTWH